MKKLITKSEIILDENLKVWETVLENVNFPKEYLNLGAEYCDHHAKAECEIARYVDIVENTSTLILALNILSQLNLSKFENIYLTKNMPTVRFAYNCEVTEDMKHYDIFDFASDKINNVVEDINKQIEESDKNTLMIDLFASNIILMTEASMQSRVGINCKYNLV
jgi:hypothetical protein